MEKRAFFFRVLLPVFLLVLTVFLMLFITDAFSGSADSASLHSMEMNIRRTAAQYYAVEGVYPDSLSVLEKEYGLILNRTKYVYHYENMGDNLMPQIRVFALGAQ